MSTSWGRHFRYYTEGPRGELHTCGDFVHGRPFVTLGYFLWTRTGFAQHLGLDLPPSYSAAHYRLTAKVAREGILYLDYTRLYDGRDLRYRFAEHDYHNSSTANQLIAGRLAADLLHHR